MIAERLLVTDEEDDFALHGLCGVVGEQIGAGAKAKFFKLLGQFPRDAEPPCRKMLCANCERLQQAMG